MSWITQGPPSSSQVAWTYSPGPLWIQLCVWSLQFMGLSYSTDTSPLNTRPRTSLLLLLLLPHLTDFPESWLSPKVTISPLQPPQGATVSLTTHLNIWKWLLCSGSPLLVSNHDPDTFLLNKPPLRFMSPQYHCRPSSHCHPLTWSDSWSGSGTWLTGFSPSRLSQCAVELNIHGWPIYAMSIQLLDCLHFQRHFRLSFTLDLAVSLLQPQNHQFIYPNPNPPSPCFQCMCSTATTVVLWTSPGIPVPTTYFLSPISSCLPFFFLLIWFRFHGFMGSTALLSVH